jgi:hypothetical protein
MGGPSHQAILPIGTLTFPIGTRRKSRHQFEQAASWVDAVITVTQVVTILSLPQAACYPQEAHICCALGQQPP